MNCGPVSDNARLAGERFDVSTIFERVWIGSVLLESCALLYSDATTYVPESKRNEAANLDLSIVPCTAVALLLRHLICPFCSERRIPICPA